MLHFRICRAVESAIVKSLKSDLTEVGQRPTYEIDQGVSRWRTNYPPCPMQ
jgi:hypothetical protein